MDLAINYFSVVVAAVISFVIGWAWFSPILFVKPWMQLRGKDPEAAMAGGMKLPVGPMAGEFVAQLIIAYVLAVFIAATGSSDWAGALHVAFLAWIGFYLVPTASALLWEKMPLKLYAIYAGRWLAGLAAMALVLGLWR
jgi:hypothetical protein